MILGAFQMLFLAIAGFPYHGSSVTSLHTSRTDSCAIINVSFGADESHGWKAIRMPPAAPLMRQLLRNLRAKLADNVQELWLHAQLAAT
jgi:hypothetical protein